MQSASPATNASLDEIIVVQGYSDRYAAAVRELLDIEGGHVNDPVDRGGETKYGVSLRFLAAEGAFDEDGDGKADFDLDFDGDIDGADIRALTVGDAIYLYHRCFWLTLEADSFPAPVGEMLFDQAVNGGALAARKLLQRAINNCLLLMPASKISVGLLKVDGVIGEKTRKAMREVLLFNSLAMPALVTAYRDAVRERYRAIVRRFPAQKRFERGWLARAERLGRA
ncbi:glycoside hydrolase family 108 protein [Novosphingobium sp. NDB2Meth1]|uniref:glycoside hydrolase family 108 protein n=1 Tax=Novosphingobium sp. NDB2Meth1 TaxID=1892847 RepID=UPI0009311185|nr:glycosyl hydrolase 108 family protein [Novosphingobium sp. NDB2Meth1]